MDNGNVTIVDEQNPITVAGNILFHNHWAASEPVKITDRSASKGTSSTNPITSTRMTPILHAIKPCGSFSTGHYSSCGTLQYVTDGGRQYSGPAFYSYFGVADPPGWRVGSGNTAGTAYSAGFLPRYTYASGGLLIIEGNSGDLIVLRHSGAVTSPGPTPTTGTVTTAPSNTPTKTITPTTAPTVCVGDISGDFVINLTDYSILVQNFLKNPILNTKADLNKDGIVDLSDYSILVSHFLKPCSSS